MLEILPAVYQEIEEFKLARAKPITIKSFSKVSARCYKLELSTTNATATTMELVAQIEIPDGYPDKSCTFTLSLVPGRSAKATNEEEKKGMTKFPDDSPVEPILSAMKTEIE